MAKSLLTFPVSLEEQGATENVQMDTGFDIVFIKN